MEDKIIIKLGCKLNNLINVRKRNNFSNYNYNLSLQVKYFLALYVSPREDFHICLSRLVMLVIRA